MQFLALVGTQGAMPEEALEVMGREFPAYLEEMDPRGVRVTGRELDFPAAAVTVRVRDGQTLISDGPFVDTKEFIGGFDLLACADLDEAVEVEAKNPVAWFLPFEIRPVVGTLAFAGGELPDPGFMLLVHAPDAGDPGSDGARAWRAERAANGELVLGGELTAPASGTTLRPGPDRPQRSDEPILGDRGSVVAVELLACADRATAVARAASHPLAERYAIEVRPLGG